MSRIKDEDNLSATCLEEAIISAMRNLLYTILIRIEGKTGRLIETLSTLTEEHELLFKSKTEFTVKSIGLYNNPLEFAEPIKTVILIEK